ncbi:hypothetical protein DB31_5237 [Hyalangium minutum]|uniref:Uncharacterized protein n=1 Tax=Hyalangium minutum TaxID=394096 RepID=A0A085WR82_9BACT|nr:hypothetical protein DB31_5237 [Hyalangium minutum]
MSPLKTPWQGGAQRRVESTCPLCPLSRTLVCVSSNQSW